MSPTQRTLVALRKLGYLAAVVEHWNPHAKIRQDLFGVIDVLAVAEETLAVQATTGANVSARVKKLQAAEAVPRILAAGWRMEVWGWRQLSHARRWQVRRVRLSLRAGSATVWAAEDDDAETPAG